METKWIVSLNLIFCVGLMQSGCSLEASIDQITDGVPDISDIQNKSSVDSDFISAEVITTNSGVVFSGAIGELSELKNLPNGVQIRGVLYE